jgi:hypothetical protein
MPTCRLHAICLFQSMQCATTGRPRLNIATRIATGAPVRVVAIRHCVVQLVSRFVAVRRFLGFVAVRRFLGYLGESFSALKRARSFAA